MPMTDGLEKRYTLQEVANHFSVSERTIHRWLQSGEISGMFVGRLWRFTLENIHAKEKASLRTEGQKGARKKRSYVKRGVQGK